MACVEYVILGTHDTSVVAVAELAATAGPQTGSNLLSGHVNFRRMLSSVVLLAMRSQVPSGALFPFLGRVSLCSQPTKNALFPTATGHLRDKLEGVFIEFPRGIEHVLLRHEMRLASSAPDS